MQEFDSDFIYDIDDSRSVISEPAPHYNGKYRKAVHSLERYRTDDQARYVPINEEYHLQPLLRVRSLKAIDHHTLSAPSSPVLQPRYRSYERSNVHYRQNSANQHGYNDNYQSSISKSASMPNGGFPVQQQQPQIITGPLPMSHYQPQQAPIVYRERVIDRHVAERSTARDESHRQQQSNGSMQTRSASASGQSQTLNRTIPVRYEAAATNGCATAAAGSAGGAASSSSYRHSNGYNHDQHPNYFYNNEQQNGGDGSYRQQSYPPQYIGPHPTRIVN